MFREFCDESRRFFDEFSIGFRFRGPAAGENHGSAIVSRAPPARISVAGDEQNVLSRLPGGCKRSDMHQRAITILGLLLLGSFREPGRARV